MTTEVSSRSERVRAFLQSVSEARLIFALDATMSRKELWDTAARLQGLMFEEADKIGGLEVQLVCYRGLGEFHASHWTRNAAELGKLMVGIDCHAGETQIGKILAHIRREHAIEPVAATVFVGDAMEENASTLYDAAAGLPPIFLFQEGDNEEVKTTFRKIAQLTGGAYGCFNAGAAKQLAEFLKCVAVFAAGGRKALSDLNSASARLLLTQMKK